MLNIFVVDKDPSQCANLAIKHVNKMCPEACQLLYTAWHVLLSEASDNLLELAMYEPPEGGYRKTHVNHPCSIWVRSDVRNYVWTTQLAVHLLAEHYRRREISGKPFVEAKMQKHIFWLQTNVCPYLPHAYEPGMMYMAPESFAIVSDARAKTACNHAVCTYRRLLACVKAPHVVVYPKNVDRPRWWAEATLDACWERDGLAL